MNFKDIVNRSNVNLQNCDEEPIHIPGSIQPHGFLISIDATTLEITVCSENVIDYIGLSHEQILTQPIDTFFDEGFIRELNQFKCAVAQQGHVFTSTILNNFYSITLNSSGNQIIIEGEPTKNQFGEINDLYHSSKQLLSYIEDSYTLKELTNVVAVAIKNITNYDRVMVYRFDENYNGEVIAESKESHLESYLGLHYPHTDIPVQARELYLKNHLRIIGDVNYKPVPLYKSSLEKLENLDLSLSVLRSVSPIHVEYLHNMGVGATLTISLLHKSKLWGLITCHHYSPKYLSQEIRTTVKLHGHFITSQIDVRLLNEEYEVGRKANFALEQLTSKNLTFDRESINHLFQDKAILDLSNSTGVSAIIDNEIYTFGITPSKSDIKRLSIFMSQYIDEGSFSTNSLSRVTSDLSFISSSFPGINYYSLDNSDCLIWYRNPTISEINWAGDPNKSIEKNKNGLSPRKSFEIFTESVKDSSKVWLKAELSANQSFYNFFHHHLRSIFLNEEKESHRKLTEILKEANAELENINWISTHDLQEPLRKIRMMASMIMGDEVKDIPEDVQTKILKMQSSAERMQILISDILKYTKTSVTVSNYEVVNLNLIIDDIKVEIQDALEDNNATIICDDLPQINGISFLIKQLFTNIIYNSLKFKSNDRLPVIKISTTSEFLDESVTIVPGNYYKIQINDNGIGFENLYSEKIFKIFSRLNNQSEYPGSGIGLALCKKIMAKHNGIITAEGNVDEGAQFNLYFPML